MVMMVGVMVMVMMVVMMVWGRRARGGSGSRGLTGRQRVGLYQHTVPLWRRRWGGGRGGGAMKERVVVGGVMVVMVTG